MLVDAKEFLHTIQKHELDREHLMYGIKDMASDPRRLVIAQQQGLEFYFVFPDLVVNEDTRVIQLLLRRPDAPEINGAEPAVRAYDILKILSH